MDISGQLSLAIFQQNLTQIETVLSDATFDPNVSSSLFPAYTPFHLACLTDFLPTIDLFLACPRTDVNKVTAHGVTPLAIVVGRVKPVIAIRLLADERVDVNIQDDAGVTPFYLACCSGDVELVKGFLARKDLDVNLTRFTGSTPFFMACQNGHVEIVKLLLQDGRTRPYQRMLDGQSPFTVICELNQLEILAWMIYMAKGADFGLDNEIDVEKSLELIEMEDWRQLLIDIGQPFVTGLDLAQQKGHTTVVQLIELYMRDPLTCRQEIAINLGLACDLGAEIFAMVILLSDGYLEFREEEENEEPQLKRFRKFFRYGLNLHLDLQMVLCNRAVGLDCDIIPTQNRERSIRNHIQFS